MKVVKGIGVILFGFMLLSLGVNTKEKNKSNVITFYFSLDNHRTSDLSFYHVKYFFTDTSNSRKGTYNLLCLMNGSDQTYIYQSGAKSYHADSLPRNYNRKQIVYNANNKWMTKNTKKLKLKAKFSDDAYGLKYSAKGINTTNLSVRPHTFFTSFKPTFSWSNKSMKFVNFEQQKQKSDSPLLALSFENAEQLIKSNKRKLFITYKIDSSYYVCISSLNLAGQPESLPVLIKINSLSGKKELIECELNHAGKFSHENLENFEQIEWSLITREFKINFISGKFKQIVKFYKHNFWLGYTTGYLSGKGTTSKDCIVSVICG